MRKTVSDAVLVSSPENELIRRLRRLAAGRADGEVLVEGPRAIAQAAAAGVLIEVLICREGEDYSVPARRTVTVPRGLFSTIAQTRTPQGVLAIGRADLADFATARAAAQRSGWPLVVLDGLQDPGNVGTIARSAAAAGAPALVVLAGTADPLGSKAIRASAGHIFNLVAARGDWTDLAGLNCVGASAEGRSIEEVDVRSVDALVFGGEAHGLSRPLAMVALPMAAGVESLNVAAAAAVLLYEFRRRLAA